MSKKLSKTQQFIAFIQKIVFLHLVIFVLRNFYYLLEKLVRKDKRIALFFMTEKYYYDNSKYLFEHMRQKEYFRSVLFTANKALYVSLNEKFPGEVVYAWSLKGLFLFLRTRNVIISYGTSAAPFFPYYLHEKCKNIIYLGHGTPVKRIGFQTSVWNEYGKSYQLQKYSYLTACSDIDSLMLASGFRATLDRIWITGMPRYDYLLSENNRSVNLLEKHPYLDKKVILYAPTWRDGGSPTQFFPFDDFSIEQLDGFLIENDVYLLVRGHKESVNRKSLDRDEDLFSLERVIKAEQDTFPDVTELLPFVDILITDYSSILVDFLLLEKPMCFIPYDLEEYKSYQGILLDYDRNSPGKKFTSMQELTTGLQDYIENPNQDQEWRQRVCKTYHHFSDHDNCVRIYNQIRKLNQ
jgi:CDP-glycerol glycerophosphotransferase (TagB/SpsB family)